MGENLSFFQRKDIEFSVKRYVQDALSAMALGLFSSLLIGLIIKTIGEQSANLVGANAFSAFLVEAGGIAMGLMGPAIGVAVAFALKAPPLVLFTCAVVGQMGATMTGFGIEMAGDPQALLWRLPLDVSWGRWFLRKQRWILSLHRQ